MQTNKDYFKIIQITDSHLFKDNESVMFGLSCNNNFKRIVNEIKKSELHDADAIFLTGDLSQDETVESYTYLLTHINELNKPTYWIPGNHDSPETMKNVFKKSHLFNEGRKLPTSFWDFIFVNSRADGRDSGHISSDELKKLSAELESAKNNVVIVMHHHPFKVNTPLVDGYILENRDEFWKVVNAFNVNLIICGHVHNDYTLQLGKTVVEAAPATCLQWKKGTCDFTFEEKTGFKVYYFWKDFYEAKAKIFDI